MKKRATTIILMLVIGLAFANIILFARSVILADNTVKLEENFLKIAAENEDLEHQLYVIASFESLNKKAAGLGFVKKAEPLYLESLRFAQAQ